jgi:HEAT repeat protein
MNADEQSCIEGLQDRSTSDADHVSCIEVLEVLMSLEALPILVQVLSDRTRSSAVRRRAALAIHELGTDSVKNDLVRLGESGDATTRELANIALS